MTNSVKYSVLTAAVTWCTLRRPT